MALLLTCLAPGPSDAQHVFDYGFDRFTVDGNHYGALDGTPDLVEDFNAFGTFTPLLGTAQLSGGLVHLTNPGSHVALLGPTGTQIDLDTSLVLNSGGPVDGAGNFTATAVLHQQSLAVNDAVTFGATGINKEAVALALSNFDATLAAATGCHQGYALSLLFLNTSVVPQVVLSVASTGINANSITGDIVFKMSFDDSTNMLTASFSLNGGSTFQTPFAPIAIFRTATSYNFLLYADPQSIAGMTTTTLAPTTSTSLTTTTSTSSTTLPPVCGDGVRTGLEQCDDGGTAPGDGCSDTCTVESGWSCTGQPSVCQLGGNQTILGKQLQVRDPQPGVSVLKRKLVAQGVETASPNTIVGNPILTGATITFFTEGANPASQTFDLPREYWKLSGFSGFKYAPARSNGYGVTAVKAAQIKKSPSGTFRLTATVTGATPSQTGAIDMATPNPGTGGCVLFAINGGDSYHIRFGAGALITKNDARTFTIKNATSEGLCP